MDSGHLPFPQPIHASRPIETLLHLRNAATLPEQLDLDTELPQDHENIRGPHTFH